MDWWNQNLDVVSHPTLNEAYYDLDDFKDAVLAYDETFDLFEHNDHMLKIIFRHFISHRLCNWDKRKWMQNYFGPRYAELISMYEKMYDSADMIQSPLLNRNYTITHTGTIDEATSTTYGSKTATEESKANSGYNNDSEQTTNTSENTRTPDLLTENTNQSNSNGSNKFSDTPQGKVENLTDGFLTNVTLTGDSTSGTDSSHESGTEVTTGSDSTERAKNTSYLDTYNKTGERSKSGTDSGSNVKTFNDVVEHQGYDNTNVSKLLQAYRETLININKQLIDDVADCFLMVYDWIDGE